MRVSQANTITRNRRRRFALDQSEQWRGKDAKRVPSGRHPV
jgi:hypothetical protein